MNLIRVHLLGRISGELKRQLLLISIVFFVLLHLTFNPIQSKPSQHYLTAPCKEPVLISLALKNKFQR